MRLGTYSIVARDQGSGELGVAVQSHWFSVGSVVAWAQAGVGAAATQSVAEVAHGPGMIEQMRTGLDAGAAVAAVLRQDELARYRQLGAVDAHGVAAAHTGAACTPEAGDIVGAGFACQANMMATSGVPEAMADAYASSNGDLAERLLAALEAAQGVGGDVRGCQSAALVVVPASGERWRSRFDLRVDDNPAPLAELRRLLVLARAYELAGEADSLLAAGERARARALYMRAADLAPEADELTFWAGLAVAADDLGAGVELVRAAVARKPAWLTLLERLPAELEPAAARVRKALSAPHDDSVA